MAKPSLGRRSFLRMLATGSVLGPISACDNRNVSPPAPTTASNATAPSSQPNLIVGRSAKALRAGVIRTDISVPTIAIRPNLTQNDLPIAADTLQDNIAKYLAGVFFNKKYTKRALYARELLGIPSNHAAVLSIDGGGVRGLIPLACLERLERFAGAPCYEVFDIICGTSTGAIVGSLIASGMKAAEIRNFYRTEAHRMFPLARRGKRSDKYGDPYVLDVAPFLDDFIDALVDGFEAAGININRTTRRGLKNFFASLIEAGVNEWIDDLAANSIQAWKKDRDLRLIGGSPVYSKDFIRPRLREHFSERGCDTLGALARKNQCMLVLTAVDGSTGSSIFMSATGSDLLPGSCEGMRAASCVESSMSAPLYFTPFKNKLLDGGTLSSNMPLLGAMLHLERQTNRKVHLDFSLCEPQVQAFCRGGSPGLVPAIENLVFQTFDINDTTIFSLGCGVGPVKALNQSLLNISNDPRHYHQKKWPYGELSKAFEIVENLPAGSEIIGASLVGALAGGAAGGGVGALVGELIGAAITGGDSAKQAKNLVENMQDSFNHHSRFGLGATVNTLNFLKEGLGRDVWTIQEDVFRSGMYRGNFRRFQLSLNRGMQIKGLWRFHPQYETRETVAKSNSAYKMRYRVVLSGKELKSGSYNIISIWDELTKNDMEDFIPDLQPFGGLALRWLDCIGERFADAIGEFCASKGAGFMCIDVVTDEGQDVFVSGNCRNHVTEARWDELKDALS